MELKTSSSFKTTGLLQPWQTLWQDYICSSAYSPVHDGINQPLQIMQICITLSITFMGLWDFYGRTLLFSYHKSTSSFLSKIYIKIIISHYMTCFPNISRRAQDMYHNLQDDDIMKNIFNSGRHKDKVGMQIPDWMITEEMKHTEHYRMYTEGYLSPKMDIAESSALKRSTVICFRLLERRSTRLTPPTLVPTVDKTYEMILQDTLQVSLVEHKSREEQEARENVELVNKHDGV
ncbi:hypothetical protein Tco_0930577 [Tanacetum coccineum]